MENHDSFSKDFFSKDIRQLKLNDGSIFTNQIFNHLVGKMPKLSKTEQDKLGEAITLDELRFVVTNTKDNKTPGPNEFTNEYYKRFWPEISNFLLDIMIFLRGAGSPK